MRTSQNIIILYGLYVVFGLFPSQLALSEVSSEKYEDVSLVQLLSNSETYDGRKVSVVGFYSSGTENSSLYLTSDHAKAGDRASSIWIGGYIDERIITVEEFKNQKNKYIRVKGVFKVGPAGHFRLWPGAIYNVFSIDVLSSI